MALAGFRLPPHLLPLTARLEAFFRRADVEAFATGGFVRDVMLGRSLRDIDISTTGDPLELASRLAAELGVTQFPLDGERRHARVLVPDLDIHIDLVPLHGTIGEDLRLRDYTIDALGIPVGQLASGAAPVIDPMGGVLDLRAGILRVVSAQSFDSDPLRMLRGARLAAQLGFEIEPESAALIRQRAPSLRDAAVERQRDELILILGSKRAAEGLRLADELGLLSQVLPELDEMRGVEQPGQHHWDVFGHGVEAVAALDGMLGPGEPAGASHAWLWQELWGRIEWWPKAPGRWVEEMSPGVPRLAVLKLCALLHDIGKPRTKSIDAGGRIRFFGHSEVGANMAVALLRRLHLPGRVVSHVATMIDAHLRPLQIAQFGEPTRRAVYRFFRDTGDAGIDTLFLTLADHLATAGPRVTLEGWRRHVAVVDYLLRMSFEQPVTARSKALLDGDDIMREFGLQPGRGVGELLDLLREAHASGEISTREEALALARRHLEHKARRR